MWHTLNRCFRISKNILSNIIESPIIVLLYHRVANLTDDPQGLAVTPDNFRKQMEFIKANFPVLRFEDDWTKIERTSFVITFDDGYADNLYQALPILEEFDIPATFFIASGSIGSSDEFWWDKLENIIINSRLADWPKQFVLPDGNVIGASMKPEELIINLQLGLKPFAAAKRNCFIDDLSLMLLKKYSPRQSFLPMNEAEIKTLSSNWLVTIGAHTLNHVQLSAMSHKDQEYEIIEGHRTLESIVGKKLEIFSYPFGNYNDFNQDTKEICQAAGFKKVAANFPGQAHSWTSSILIPRQIIRNMSGDRFKKQYFRLKYL